MAYNWQESITDNLARVEADDFSELQDALDQVKDSGDVICTANETSYHSSYLTTHVSADRAYNGTVWGSEYGNQGDVGDRGSQDTGRQIDKGHNGHDGSYYGYCYDGPMRVSYTGG